MCDLGARGCELFAAICKMDLEGIVSKRKDEMYLVLDKNEESELRSSRIAGTNWLKNGNGLQIGYPQPGKLRVNAETVKLK
jgi:hypothetical protein